MLWRQPDFWGGPAFFCLSDWDSWVLCCSVLSHRSQEENLFVQILNTAFPVTKMSAGRWVFVWVASNFVSLLNSCLWLEEDSVKIIGMCLLWWTAVVATVGRLHACQSSFISSFLQRFSWSCIFRAAHNSLLYQCILCSRLLRTKQIRLSRLQYTRRSILNFCLILKGSQLLLL